MTKEPGLTGFPSVLFGYFYLEDLTYALLLPDPCLADHELAEPTHRRARSSERERDGRARTEFDFLMREP